MYLLIPDFLQKVSKTRKTSQKDPSLFNTVWLKKAHSFYKSQLTKHCKEYIPATQPKTLVIFTLIFQPTCFWLTCKKPLHCTISRSPRLHSRSTWKTNICFIYFSVRKVFVPETQEAFIWFTVWASLIILKFFILKIQLFLRISMLPSIAQKL